MIELEELFESNVVHGFLSLSHFSSRIMNNDYFQKIKKLAKWAGVRKEKLIPLIRNPSFNGDVLDVFLEVAEGSEHNHSCIF